VGFTLVELLVVIAILGILAAIAVFAVGGIGEKGKQSADKTSCSVLQTAEEAYYASVVPHAYAPDQAALKAAGFLHTTNDEFTIALVDGPPKSFTVTGPDCE
jgi:prepilin-type N-terminal cleavage/methylation domain-containing protein